jgi:hypothetical protein
VGIDRTDAFDFVAIEKMLYGHFGKLRAHPIYRRCYNMVYFECNMSFVDSGRWARYLERSDSVNNGACEFARFDSIGRVGTWTDNNKKIAFAQELQRAVPTMTFASDFITCDQDSNKLRLQMIEQIRTFRKDIVAPKGDGTTQLFNKIVITGKSPGKKDDLVMALCIAMYHGFLARFDDKFQKRMRERGLVV